MKSKCAPMLSHGLTGMRTVDFEKPVFLQPVKVIEYHGQIQGEGDPDTPEKSQKYRVS